MRILRSMLGTSVLTLRQCRKTTFANNNVEENTARYNTCHQALNANDSPNGQSSLHSTLRVLENYVTRCRKDCACATLCEVPRVNYDARGVLLLVYQVGTGTAKLQLES